MKLQTKSSNRGGQKIAGSDKRQKGRQRQYVNSGRKGGVEGGGGGGGGGRDEKWK